MKDIQCNKWVEERDYILEMTLRAIKNIFDS
jgi:hypothetical protein